MTLGDGCPSTGTCAVAIVVVLLAGALSAPADDNADARFQGSERADLIRIEPVDQPEEEYVEISLDEALATALEVFAAAGVWRRRALNSPLMSSAMKVIVSRSRKPRTYRSKPYLLRPWRRILDPNLTSLAVTTQIGRASCRERV